MEKVMENKAKCGKCPGRFGIRNSKRGMELVQVGILIAIAIGLGIIFKDQIGIFVDNTFKALTTTKF